jgi:hypothetical protein
MAVGGRGRRDGRESLHRRRWGAPTRPSSAADLGALWVLGLISGATDMWSMLEALTLVGRLTGQLAKNPFGFKFTSQVNIFL